MDDSRKTAKLLTRSTAARQRPFTHWPAGSRRCCRHVNRWCGRRLRLTVISSSAATTGTFSISPLHCRWPTFARTSRYHSLVLNAAASSWRRLAASGWVTEHNRSQPPEGASPVRTPVKQPTAVEEEALLIVEMALQCSFSSSAWCTIVIVCLHQRDGK